MLDLAGDFVRLRFRLARNQQAHLSSAVLGKSLSYEYPLEAPMEYQMDSAGDIGFQR